MKPDAPDEQNDQSRHYWHSLWETVSSGLGVLEADAPLAPAKAAEILDINLPPTLQWSDLGAWPPPETWIQAIEARYSSDKSGPCGDDSLTWRRIWDGRKYVGELSIYLDVRKNGQVVARAELMKVGGGLLPRLTKVGRSSDPKNGHLLILRGHRPLPGPRGGREEWLLMIDEQSHHAWKLRW